MKTNAPEKIYLFENPISGDTDDRWLSSRSCDEDIEYTRTDAFIEKVCEWIKEKWDDNYTMPIIIDSVIDEFKNYIKGE